MANSELSIPDSTGYLGNLEAKSRQEIQYLLHRQEAIYKNEKFVKKLPDKGEKIKKLIDKIKSILEQTEKVENTADLFEKMAIDAEYTSRSRSVNTTNSERENIPEPENKGHSVPSITQLDTEENALRNMAERKEEGKEILDERTNTVSREISFVNNYAKVISKSEELAKKNPKFIPGRTLKKKTDILHADEMKKESVVRKDDVMKPKYDECLEYKHDRKPTFTHAKDISIEESVQLMQQQQQKSQQLAAQNAAEKLSKRLGFSMSAFNPEGSTYTRYRDNTEVDSDDENDADAVEKDYPD